MSDLKTYKATFKAQNKYLKYFCEKPASDWTLKKYKKYFNNKDPQYIARVFVENLKRIKDDSKSLPPIVREHITKTLESVCPISKNSSSSTPNSSTVNNITIKGDYHSVIKGNYYNAGRDMTINETVERVSKKQKTNYEDQEKIEEVNFKQKWIEFLVDAERSRNFHRYSPERNGVTRLGAKLSPHPNANKDVYRHLKRQLKPCEISSTWKEEKKYTDEIIAATSIDEFEEKVGNKTFSEDNNKTCKYIQDICKIMAKVYRKKPSISRSEAVFNINMIFPCLEAMLTMIKRNECGPYFVPGEDELCAMTTQLNEMKAKTDKRKIYKADGIIRLSEFEDLEVLVLETAGAFGHDDHAKVSFDNSKGMFALLAMLKTVADRFRYASIDEFRKLKLYFVQPSDKCIRLWSMQYAKHGLYDFVREKKVLVSEDFREREEQLASLVDFFIILKNCLEETMKTIAVLKSQHQEKEKCNDSENSHEVFLSDIVCPKVFKLSFNTHGQHFGNEHFKSSPDSDC